MTLPVLFRWSVFSKLKKKAKIKLGTKGGEQVFHKSDKKAKKPSINEYKQWVKQSQRQPKGYLDVASVGALFTN